MIMARFVYAGSLYGEWTQAEQFDPMMVPNPEFAHALLGVQFKNTENELLPATGKRAHGHKAGTVRNGT